MIILLIHIGKLKIKHKQLSVQLLMTCQNLVEYTFSYLEFVSNFDGLTCGWKNAELLRY